MAEAALETVLRRDRVIVGAALAGLAALAWGYVLWLAADMDMGGMDITGFRMIPAGLGIMAPANAPWGAIEFAFVFAMWAVMMVGMMAPSAAPMILMYARVGRQGAAEGTPFAATGWFAAGWSGSVSPLLRPSRNGRSSAPLCSTPRWRAPTTCSERWP
jgi:predicted metal-binding membrane protein